MKRLLLTISLSLFAMPAFAEPAISFARGQEIALAAYPGEVIDAHSRDAYHEYEILQEDGTSLDVQVGSRVGNIKEVEIDRLGVRFAALPESKLKAQHAKEVARDYLRGENPDASEMQIKGSVKILKGADWVYGIDIRVDKKDYEVHVNRITGDIVAVLLYEE